MQKARYEIIRDDRAMTITVGPKVFDKPEVSRRAEWAFNFKAGICGEPEVSRDDHKAWHKFYAEMLGPKFNLRFFAANYWLWIGERMTQRTANMLKYDGKNWRIYSTDLVLRAHAQLPYVQEAERDGLYNLIPLILTHGASPQAIRAKIGRGAWRRVANNSVSRNRLIMHATLRCKQESQAEAFAKLLEMPSGVMRGIQYEIGDDEVIAARITPRKRAREFQATVHLVGDTRHMLLPDEFNPQWGYARMRQEHEAATKAIMQRRYSTKVFAPEWSFQEGDYSATLLNSQADIATEGAVQHHCVASYARSAAMREYAVFRIEGEERATAGVRAGLVDQVYGACNARVSDACMAFARKIAAKYTASQILTQQAA